MKPQPTKRARGWKAWAAINPQGRLVITCDHRKDAEWWTPDGKEVIRVTVTEIVRKRHAR